MVSPKRKTDGSVLRFPKHMLLFYLFFCCVYLFLLFPEILLWDCGFHVDFMDRYVGHFLELCFCLHTLSMCECVHECMSVSMYVLCMCMYEVSVTLTLSHLKRTLNHLFRYYLLFVFMFFFSCEKRKLHTTSSWCLPTLVVVPQNIFTVGRSSWSCGFLTLVFILYSIIIIFLYCCSSSWLDPC